MSSIIPLELSLYNNHHPRCLVLIGGVGDPAEIFNPLVQLLLPKLSNHTICTFTFSQTSLDLPLLKQQSLELENVLDQLIANPEIKALDLWCTSMGSFSTVQALTNPKYNQYLKNAVFFDPADYYLDDYVYSVDSENTWSGYQKYAPSKPTISQEMSKITSNVRVSIIHLTVRNHSKVGYLERSYGKRNQDHENGYPRLNTEMVKVFFTNTPKHNQAKYLEMNYLPHAIFRDGDIEYNLKTIASQLHSLVL